MIGGLMNRTFIAPSTFEGSCNSDVFNAWLEHVLIPLVPTASTIIMDNAAFHKSAKTKQIIMDSGCHILFLPAYSPDMNPIENCWHTLKAKIRTATNDIADNLLKTLHNCLLDM
ncbi:transposase [Candidatus Lariskella endosymbiont of Epinotia ramella]|uniref:transposase n=1 Tax=Candidatus Lariskella endosymbiont of Epinotia ramella TaxID=3066224 RepID=UPI0030D5D2AF